MPRSARCRHSDIWKPHYVDIPLTLIFPLWQGACRCCFSQYRKPISEKWMSATNWKINSTACRAKHRWHWSQQWSGDCVGITFSYMSCQYIHYEWLRPSHWWITVLTMPQIVDALLTLILMYCPFNNYCHQWRFSSLFDTIGCLFVWMRIGPVRMPRGIMSMHRSLSHDQNWCISPNDILRVLSICTSMDMHKLLLTIRPEYICNWKSQSS